MRVTAIYLYPIKGLRGISLPSSPLTPQGLLHDRTFMLCRLLDDGSYQKLQLDKYPRCARFSQELLLLDTNDTDPSQGVVRVRWLGETEVDEQLLSGEEEGNSLDVPLKPDMSGLEKRVMNLHQSKVHAYLMPSLYNDFFSRHFGFETHLLYIGDGKRPVLGTLSPKATATTATAAASSNQSSSWFPSITNFFSTAANKEEGEEADWLTFTDCAPFLLTTNASLENVHSRFEGEDTSGIEMYKFRPNIVFDGKEAWDEDFWGELSFSSPPINHDDNRSTSSTSTSRMAVFTLSKMCNRCTSLNVDYATGSMSTTAEGTLLKKLTRDRRVDKGNKYSPVFGRYAFLSEEVASRRRGKENNGGGGESEKGQGEWVVLRVGEEMEVSKRNMERPVWDWPTRDERFARFYEP